MSRSNKQNKDDLEDLRRVIKEQEQTIKNLEKEIKHLKRETSKKETKKESKREDVKTCPACLEPTIKYTQLGIKTLITCTSCDFRATINNLYG